MTPELLARQHIDAQLTRSGWVVQDHKRMNLAAARGVAVRESPTDAGPANYLLCVDKRPVGVVDAKPEGTNLITVEAQTGAYADALPDWLKAPVRPLASHLRALRLPAGAGASAPLGALGESRLLQ